jgi:biopolymer transport protein ExbD
MSAGISGGRNGGVSSADSQDFELNLASIIDCFTVLIAFMLASASFLSIGILDAGVAAAGAQASPGTPPPVNIAVEIGAGSKLTLKVTGKTSSTQAMPAAQGKADYEGLARSLASLHAKYPDVNALTLTAENSVEYSEVVKAMDEIRKTIPVILLGGF